MLLGRWWSVLVLAVMLMAVGRPAHADHDIVIETQPERPFENKLILGGLAGAGALAGALGLYWHLDSRSASDEVSSGLFTGLSWTAEDQALVDRASRDRTRAAVAYSIGGGLVIAAIVVLIVTEPKTENIVIHPRRATPVVVPAESGAIVGGRWSF